MRHRFPLLLLTGLLLTSPAFATDYALLVGVKNYGKRSGLNPLKYTENDVESLASLLIDNGYRKENVTVLTQKRGVTEPALFPTQENIVRELDLILDGRDGSDSVLLAFAGHGVKFKGEKTSYFCPIDVELKGRKHLLSYDRIYEMLRLCPAQRKLLLSDACRNDPLSVTGRTATPSLTRPEPEIPPGSTVALFACQAGQEAKEDPDLEHGVFFHYVLKGLQGAADERGDDANGNGNRTVELTELAAFTQKRVQDHVRGKFRTKQIPELKSHVSNLQKLLRYPVLRLPEVDLYLTNSLGMKLRLIPAGEFEMGNAKSADELASLFEVDGRPLASLIRALYFENGFPRHRVRITEPFYLGVTEVTQGQWESVMGTTPWSGKKYVKEGSDYAATYVSWEDAVEFCRKLSAKEGREYRLPTEAEWEYACRGGSRTMYSFGDNVSALKDYAWFDANASNVDESYAHRVGLKRPNAWGLHDMHGNVYEWCSDWHGEVYYGSSPQSDPQGPSAGSYRVHRGGSWISNGGYCRSAYRSRNSPGHRRNILGFRLAAVQSR